jgi:ABC-type cobalt transport system substrate-binding protein
MPSGKADYKVEIVDSSGQADMTVAVVGDQVVDLTGATDGQVLTVQGDGTVAPESPAADPAAVPKSLYDANTVLKADTDNTPAALTMGASTILARLAAGTIVAATPTEIKTLLAIAESDVTGLVTDLAGKAMALTRTAVKTSAYGAAAGDLVPVDTTSGAVTVTLPNAPAAKTRVAVKHIIQGGTNAVTIACAGSDVFNKTGGSTTATLSLLNQAMLLTYDSSGIWTVLADDQPLSSLDLRFQPLDSDLTAIAALTTTSYGRGLLALANQAALISEVSSAYEPIATSIWIPAAGMVVSSGSAALSQIGGNQARAVAYAVDAAAAESVGASRLLPAHWTTFKATVYWTNLGAGAGDVDWELLHGFIGDGDSFGSGGTAETTVVSNTAPAQNVQKTTLLKTGIATSSGKPWFFRVVRFATNGTDTLANDAGVMGVLLEKVT